MAEKQTTADLIKKELGLEKLASNSKEAIVGNLRIEQIIKIADLKKDDLSSKTFKDNVKVIAGSCVSSGIIIEGKKPVELIKDINNGVYDEKIKNKVTEVSPEVLEKQKNETNKYIENIEKIKNQKEEEATQKRGAAKNNN